MEYNKAEFHDFAKALYKAFPCAAAITAELVGDGVEATEAALEDAMVRIRLWPSDSIPTKEDYANGWNIFGQIGFIEIPADSISFESCKDDCGTLDFSKAIALIR